MGFASPSRSKTVFFCVQYFLHRKSVPWPSQWQGFGGIMRPRRPSGQCMLHVSMYYGYEIGYQRTDL